MSTDDIRGDDHITEMGLDSLWLLKGTRGYNQEKGESRGDKLGWIENAQPKYGTLGSISNYIGFFYTAHGYKIVLQPNIQYYAQKLTEGKRISLLS